MSAFLTSLASIGSQAGEAKDEVRQETEARQNKLKEFAQSSAYLDLAKKSDERQNAEFEQRKKAGRFIEMKDGRLWDVQEGKWADQAKPDINTSLKKFMDTASPRVKEILNPKLETIASQYPYDDEKRVNAFRSEYDKAEAQDEREKAAVLTEQNRKQDKLEQQQFQQAQEKTRHTEHEQDAQTQRDFLKAMIDYRGQGLTPAAEKVLYTIDPTVKQVDRLLGDIKNLKLEKNNESGYLFRARLKYALGQDAPENTLAKDIAGLSLGSVIEAGSAMQGMGRSLTLFKKASEHVPNPWIDSPAKINTQLKEIRKRLQDMKDDAMKYGTKRGIMPPEESGTPGTVDPAVEQYLRGIGVNP